MRFTPRDGAPESAGSLAPYVPMTTLASRAPSWVCSSTRTDPYYSHLWTGANSALWTDRRTIESYIASGKQVTKAMRAMTNDIEPHDLWFNKATGYTVRTALGATLMWRLLSADQLAAVTGQHVWSGYTKGRTPPLAQKMIAAGIAHVGALPSAPGFTPPTLFKPGRFTSWQRLQRSLPFHEWLAITAGQTPTMGSQAGSLKHNMAMTELGLRIAQWCPVRAVFGENLARHDLLVPELAAQNYRGAAAADGVIITEDGGRIGIEMTVSTLNADMKVKRWITTLLADETRSLSILFVVAPGPGVTRNAASLVRRQVENALTESGVAGYSLRDRFFVSEWDEWFPRPGVVTSRFAALPAMTYDTNAKSWSWRDLLGPAGLEWEPETDDDYERTVTLTHAANTMHGVPFWLRENELVPALTERLDRFVVASSGFDHLPTLPYARANRHDGLAPERGDWLSPPSLVE